MIKTLRSIYKFYSEGFSSMTWGKQLWWLILLKIVVLIVILRMLFFTPVLSGKSETEKIKHVGNQLIKKNPAPSCGETINTLGDYKGNTR